MLRCGMRAIHRAATEMSNDARQILKNVFFLFQITQLSNFTGSMNAINLIKVFLSQQMETSNASNEIIISPDVTKYNAVVGNEIAHTCM